MKAHKLLFGGLALAVVIAVALIGMLVTEPTKLPLNHVITVEQMKHYVSNKQLFQSPGDLFAALDYERWNIEAVRRVVNNVDAKEFVVKYGAKDNGIGCSILYGINEDGKIVTDILEIARPCPPLCGDDMVRK